MYLTASDRQSYSGESVGSSPSSLNRFIEGAGWGVSVCTGTKMPATSKTLPVLAGTGQDRVAIALQVAVRYINPIFSGGR